MKCTPTTLNGVNFAKDYQKDSCNNIIFIEKNIYNINSLSLVYLSVCDTAFCCKSILLQNRFFQKSGAVLKQTWCLSVCSSQTFADRGQGSGMKELYVHPSVRPSVFLSFFLSFCLSVRPFVSPSIHPSFFQSLTSPSSLAPFSVSLIYIFLVSFSGSHVIGLLNMCSNVHTTAYMQLLDFLPILHLKYMISNFNIFEGFFMENKWSEIGQTLWKKKVYKTLDFYDKFY